MVTQPNPGRCPAPPQPVQAGQDWNWRWLASALALAFLTTTARAQNQGSAVLDTTIAEFLAQAHNWGESRKVRLRGVVTHVISDGTYFIQEGDSGVYAFHKPAPPVMVGDTVSVSASPSLGGLRPTLQHCDVTITGRGPQPEPRQLQPSEVLLPLHAMRLVRLRGRLGDQTLANGRKLFLTLGRSVPAVTINLEALPADAMPAGLVPGSLIEATGVLNLRSTRERIPTEASLLARSAHDLRVLAGPPFWSLRNLARVLAVSLLVLGLCIAWVWTLRRQVREQTALVARRLEREAALRASEDRFLKIFNACPDPILIFGSADGLVIDVNPAFERTLGYTRANLLDVPVARLGPWAAALGEARPATHGEYCVTTRGGEERECVGSVESIELRGAACRLAVLRDVSAERAAELEQQRLRQTLHQHQKMEALGTLAGGVAHDFNNILGAILGSAELARTSLGPTHPSQAQLSQILIASRRARELVQSILFFSRAETPEPELFQLAPVVREACDLLRVTLPHSLQLDADLPPRPLALHGHSTQIFQVVLNLGTNAIHAMAGRTGRISIRVDSIAVAPEESPPATSTALRPGSYAVLEVADEGMGIDAATQARLFEPFFTTKGPGIGTGFGLPLVRAIAQAHGGATAVESNPGHGARFRVYLPLADRTIPPPAAPVSMRPAAAGPGRRILLVDDEETLLVVFRLSLERQGHRVSPFQDAHTALETFLARPSAYDVIITDQNMPGLTGMELIAAVRAAGHLIPMILTSGILSDDTGDDGLYAGASMVLAKPVTPADLITAVNQVCDGIASAAPGPVSRDAPQRV